MNECTRPLFSLLLKWGGRGKPATVGEGEDGETVEAQRRRLHDRQRVHRRREDDREETEFVKYVSRMLSGRGNSRHGTTFHSASFISPVRFVLTVVFPRLSFPSRRGWRSP